MVVEVSEINLPQIYPEVIMRMMIEGKKEESRNGPVLSFLAPFFLEIQNPTERVIFDPIRDANPFFHLMEFIWMMSGSNKAEWIAQFNKRYHNYAEPDGTVHGAYGHRWIRHFNAVDQIVAVTDQLKKDRTTRRAVLGMWDPRVDLEPHADLPCNTHIYLRVEGDALNMTVCNRSNDIIWGMLGANVVHMTLLQELIAHGSGLGTGSYMLMSNNAHVYTQLPKVEQILATRAPVDPYTDGKVEPFPLMQPEEEMKDMLMDCYDFVHTTGTRYRTKWMNEVAVPMYLAWYHRKDGGSKIDQFINKIQATDWRMACLDWVARRSLSSTSTGH
jgi:thymidylate synthase